MRILLINHYAGSDEMGMEYRPWYMGIEWIRLGHEVVIIASTFAHVRQSQPAGKSDLQEDLISGLKYVWLQTPPYTGNGIGRAINMLHFAARLNLYAKKLAKRYKPDVVIASSTYTWDNYGARKIAHLAGAEYVYEVHDLWPLSPMELGNMSKHHPFIAAMQHAENFAYRHAHAVISMLPKTLGHMQQHGLNADKWHYVPNGIKADEWDKEMPDKHAMSLMLADLKADGYFRVGYTGSMGLANALDNLVRAADLLRDEKITILIVGDGPEKQNLIKKVKDLNLNNVIFSEPIPKYAIPELLSNLDAMYIGLQRQPLFRFGISPNKMLDYMMAGKPVIQAIDAGNDMVSEAGCGISIPAEDPGELASAIQKLKDLPEQERVQMGNRGREFVKKNHDYRELAKKMIGIFENLK